MCDAVGDPDFIRGKRLGSFVLCARRALPPEAVCPLYLCGHVG